MTTRPFRKKKPSPPLTLWNLVRNILFISSTTPGGGYAIISVLGRSLNNKLWMSTESYNEVFALVQAVPGPVACNVCVVVGKRLFGYKGAILCGLASVLPPFGLILLVYALLAQLPDSKILTGAIKGSYAVALGFVASITLKVIMTFAKNIWKLVLSVSSAGLMLVFPHLFLLWFLILIVVLYRFDTWKTSQN